MTRILNIAFFVSTCGLIVLVSAQNYIPRASPELTRQVEVFVNVYDHPKTGFSCNGRAPGEYYADPATKCAVYYICLSNPTGTLSPQSFACPNGTIFSQATRVCRPHEEVYCNLATRYYDNTQGIIDTKGVFDTLPLPVPIPDQPAVPSTRRQSPPRTQLRSQPQPAPQPQPLTPAPQPVTSPKPAPAPNGNLFNSNSRFRNSRTFQAPTTSSTTLPPPLPAAGSALGDYEYDYNDAYANETGLQNAASSVHAQIIENIAEAIAKETKEGEQTEVTNSKATRRKRESEPWMLNRRKGQLMEREALSDILAESAQSNGDLTLTPISFTCEDKIGGVAYADMASGCSKFYVCVTVSKGKQWAYHLNCDEGKRFNQVLGMCDVKVSKKACEKSEHYYAYNKLHKASKKHLMESALKKQSAMQ